MPAFTVLSILLGIGLHAACSWCARLPQHRTRAAVLLHAAVLVQFAVLLYDPTAQRPTPADRFVGANLVQRIAQTPGDVFVPGHPYLARRAGKREFLHGMAYFDLLRAAAPDIRDRLANEVNTAIARRAFAAIILDHEDEIRDLQEWYERSAPIQESDADFFPVTGYRTRPEFWLVPRAP